MAIQDCSYVVRTRKDVCRAKGVRPIKELAMSLEAQEQEICLDCRNVGRQLTDNDILTIGTILYDDLPHLLSFTLAHLPLNSNALRYLSSGIKRNSHLKAISLTNCSISDSEGVYSLSLALHQNTVLEELDLSYNELTEDSASSLADVLVVNSALKALNLSHNRLDGSSFVVALSVNTSLKVIDLTGNLLNPENIVKLVKSLKDNKQIAVFKASRSEVAVKPGQADEIVRGLAVSLKSSKLRQLNLDAFGASDEALLELSSVLESSNRTLIKLHLGSERLSNDLVLGKIKTAVKANRILSEKKLTSEVIQALPDPLSSLVLSKMTGSSLSSFSETLQAFPEFFEAKSRSGTSSADKSPRKLEDVPEMMSPSASLTTPLLNLHGMFKQEVDEDVIISQSYGTSPRESNPLEAEEKSLISSSAFFDSPRNFVYSESSETPRYPISKSLPASRLKEVSFGKNGDLREMLQGEMPLSVATINSRIEQIEQELTEAYDSVSKKVLRAEEQFRTQQSESAGLLERIQTLEALIKRVTQRVEKTELESTDFAIDSMKLKRENEERFGALERKETAKLRLFEELGNEIDGLKADLKETNQSVMIQKSLSENIRLRQEKHEKMLESHQRLLEERCNASLSAKLRQEVKTMVKETIVELTETGSLDLKTDLEIDKLKGQVKALQTELNARLQKVEVGDQEGKSHRCTQVSKAIHKIDRRITNVEDYLAKETQGSIGSSIGQSPPASFRSNSAKLTTILIKLEDRLSEIEREQLNYSSTKRRVADVVKRVKNLEDRSKHQKDTEPKEATPKTRTIKEADFREAPPKGTNVIDEEMRLQIGRKQSLEASYQEVSVLQGQETSVDKALRGRDSSPSENVALLKGRISQIEKLRIHKQAYAFKTEAPIRTPSPSSSFERQSQNEALRHSEVRYAPGETENLVLNAITERNSKLKITEKMQLRYGTMKTLSPLSASFNSLPPFSIAQSPKNTTSASMIFRDERKLPSEELQEHLKQRGFHIKETRPMSRQ